jgi:prepilin-type N-terminal cleavage/methylation domain-containing protein
MRRRAFSLIELLVVIAIIAILAAILFPVFARAKIAAKKTVDLSNQKQLGLALIIYASDHDDTYPRNDDCTAGSSLNPKLNDRPFQPDGVGCTTGGFFYRMNHFSWQKWIMPYVGNVDVFTSPLRQRDPDEWNVHGQIVYGFMLNTAITGSLDTYDRPSDFPRQFRNSWLGGRATAVPDPASANILLEAPLMRVAALPGASVDSEGVDPEVTVYPVAVREFWRWRLMDGNQSDCVNRMAGTEPDGSKMPSLGITVGFCDGHSKFLPAGKFLAMTPSKSEYLGADPESPTSGWSFPLGVECSFNDRRGNYGFSSKPNLAIDYPFWGLGR